MQHSFWNHMEFLWNFRHYFGEYPLQNDGHNWLRIMHNSFISDKKWNISFRERAGLTNIYNKKGKLNFSNRNTTCVNKIIFYFDGTKIIFDARFDINSAYQNSGCNFKSTLHVVQDYCLSFGGKICHFPKGLLHLVKDSSMICRGIACWKTTIYNFLKGTLQKEWHLLLCNQRRLHCCI